MTKEKSKDVEFEVHTWEGKLWNFGKDISYTIDVRIDGKRKAIIYIPQDGSEPETMEYEREGFTPGIDGKTTNEIVEKSGLYELIKEVYPRLFKTSLCR